MTPGWYDDPWATSSLRWWDGTQWTPHAHHPGYAPASYLAPIGVEDLNGVERWGRRASLALAIGAAFTVALYLLYATLLHSVLHNIEHQFRVYNDQLNADPDSSPALHLHVGRIFLLEFAALPVLVVQIVFIIWLFQAAGLGQRLRLPAAHERMWAIIGYIIPIVNFWFPYEVARDLLPPSSPSSPSPLRSCSRWSAACSRCSAPCAACS
jgi:hypothetical protein